MSDSTLAFNSDAVRGVTKNQDLHPSLVNRDVRPLRYRISAFLTTNGGLVVAGIAILFLAASLIGGLAQYGSDFALALLLPFGPPLLLKRPSYPYRVPILPDSDMPNLDDNDGGGFFLGNDLETGAALWLSSSDVKTHMLVFGSTGSGKTRYLLGMFYQALLIGSGAMYVDGKGDNTVFWLAYTLCRRLGRDDDLLVINYLLGDKSKTQGPSLKRITNTSNMLAYGDAEQLRSLIVGLMREAGGEGGMWKGRASAMLQALFTTLCYLRDEGEILLDVDKLRESMPLDNVLRLYQRRDLPERATTSLARYLGDLPGFTEESAMRGTLNAEAYKQHGFLMMQLTEVLADLSDTYGHIFSAPMGEVDFKDVVFNRRILFVMLPALQKDPDALEGLGKMVVAGVRAALAPALGEDVEGSYEEVIAAKPSNSQFPFLIILDEYGYYAVKGFAVVAAQARSLGVCVIFAGQDYPSFKRSSEEEAASTVANTNAKLGMKNEDAKETADILIGRAGEADVVKTTGSNKKESSGYRDNDEARIEQKKKISVRDLANQKPGQAHVILGDTLTRTQLFFADPKNARNAQLNRFLMVGDPSDSVVERMKSAYERIDERLTNIQNLADESPEADDNADQGLALLAEDLKYARSRRQTISEAALYAVGLIDLRNRLKDKEQTEGLEGAENPDQGEAEAVADPQPGTGTTSAALAAAEKSNNGAVPADSDTSEASGESSAKEGESALGAKASHLAAIDSSQAPQPSAEDAAQDRKAQFLEALTAATVKSVTTSLQRPLTAEEAEAAKPEAILQSEALATGLSEEAAQSTAQDDVEVLARKVTYIHEPIPARPDQAEIHQRLQELRDQVNSEGEEDDNGDAIF